MISQGARSKRGSRWGGHSRLDWKKQSICMVRLVWENCSYSLQFLCPLMFSFLPTVPRQKGYQEAWASHGFPKQSDLVWDLVSSIEGHAMRAFKIPLAACKCAGQMWFVAILVSTPIFNNRKSIGKKMYFLVGLAVIQ